LGQGHSGFVGGLTYEVFGNCGPVVTLFGMLAMSAELLVLLARRRLPTAVDGARPPV
jgi:hypothetical protein